MKIHTLRRGRLNNVWFKESYSGEVTEDRVINIYIGPRPINLSFRTKLGFSVHRSCSLDRFPFSLTYKGATREGWVGLDGKPRI